MLAVLVMGLCANVANHAARRAHTRELRERAAIESLAAARAAREAYRDRAA
jgi:hypothetical protein